MAKEVIKKAVKKTVKKPTAGQDTEPGTKAVWSHRIEQTDDNDQLPDDRFPVSPGRSAKGRTKASGPESLRQGVAVGDQDMPPVGVAYPSFCLEMWTMQSVFQAESCYAICGPTASYKSHFVMEVARWILGAGGRVDYNENENKYNGDMAMGLLGPQLGKRVLVTRCDSFTEVQEVLLDGIKVAQKDPQYVGQPYLQIVDSIVGNTTDEQKKRIKTNKGVERDWAANALAAANFLPAYMPELASHPIFGLWVTHSKDTTEKLGHITKTTTTMKGGESWKYRCRLAIVMHRTSPKPKHENDNWVVRIRFGLLKDMGVLGFTLPVHVKYTHSIAYDEEIDDYYKIPKIEFCWDVASVNIMMDPGGFGYPESWSTIFKDLLGLKYGKGRYGKKIIVADKIGLPEHPDNTAKKFMSQLYHPDNKKTLDLLRASLGIKKGLVITPGCNYNELVLLAKQIAAKRAARADKGEVVYVKKGEIFQDV